MFKWLVLFIAFQYTLAATEVEVLSVRYTEGGIHLPLLRRHSDAPSRRRGSQVASIGLGDYRDVTYNVLIQVGETLVPVVVDTGSSDLWVISDSCQSSGDCSTSLALYPQSSFKYAGYDAALLYGDSSTVTHADGPIGMDTVTLAGLSQQNQFFAAINDTNTSVLDTGSAGIFGLGFPINSLIWQEAFSNEANSSTKSSIGRRSTRLFPHIARPSHLARAIFPDIPSLYPRRKRQTSSSADAAAWSTYILSSFAQYGNFLSRFVETDNFKDPMFAITLQRDYIDVGGNIGLLSIGELPDETDNSSLTWVPLRYYSSAEGGLSAPTAFPDEQYPMTWEIFIDAVYFDGTELPNSTLASSSIAMSALIDTGNSLVRGPSDTVAKIYSALGGQTFNCSVDHTLAFKIGGQMFPIDPRDFISQSYSDNADECSANIVVTDVPQVGGYLYSWSLGDPFLKSVLSAFHFGNISYPSLDPPRIGLLSTVPSNASQLLQDSVASAKAEGNFPDTSQAAPTGTATASSAGGSNNSSKNSGEIPSVPLLCQWMLLLCIGIFFVL